MAAAKVKKTTEKKKPAKKPVEKKAEGFTTKKYDDYTVSQKRSGRYEVTGKNGKNINGTEKTKILLDAKLIKTGISKAKPAEEATPSAESETPPAAT
jgi:hypothetical protein